MQVQFWLRHVLLLYALHVLCAVFSFFSFSWSLLLVFVALWHPLFLCASTSRRRFAQRLGVSLAMAGGFFFFLMQDHSFPQLPQKGTEGEATFQIESIQFKEHAFGPSWTYRGVLKGFEVLDCHEQRRACSIARNVPFYMHVKGTEPKLQGNVVYLMKSTLLPSMQRPFCYRLKPSSVDDKEILSVSIWNWPEWRFAGKQALYSYLKQHFNNERALQFLRGILLGEVDDRFLSLELGRNGLQHILAISGLHFSLLSLILQVLLRLFLRFTSVNLLLVLLLTAYFLLLGPMASVQRAWMTAMVVLSGMLLGKEPLPLNTLGVTLLLSCLVSPLSCLEVGFQFSFVVTAAILFFYPLAERGMGALWHRHRFSFVVELSLLQQHGYLLLSYCRSVCSLALAVHAVSIPLTLYHFQCFHWMGLFYNFFFPLGVSLVLLLAVVGFLFSPLPFQLDQMIHYLNQKWILLLLRSVDNLPLNFDLLWYHEGMGGSFLLSLLLFALLFGIVLHQKQQKDALLQWMY